MFTIIFLALLAFALFFAYDAYSVRHVEKPAPAALFFAACALVLIAMAIMLVTQIPHCPWDVASILCLILALVGAGLTIKALFFSLPADTYTTTSTQRRTYTKGMYALCRHPGVLWYCLMFAGIAGMLRTPVAIAGSCALCAGNIAYMLFQDAWSFPKLFCDYDEYKKRVPLFFPTAASIKAALMTNSSKAKDNAHGAV